MTSNEDPPNGSDQMSAEEIEILACQIALSLLKELGERSLREALEDLLVGISLDPGQLAARIHYLAVMDDEMRQAWIKAQYAPTGSEGTFDADRFFQAMKDALVELRK